MEKPIYKASYYNLLVPHGPYTLLFNGVSSGLLRLPPQLAEPLRPFLGPERSRDAGRGRDDWSPPRFSADDLPAGIQRLFPELLRGRFFVEDEVNEAAELRERFQHFRQRDPFMVTITTTMDCNLACYYCYEDKEPVYLSVEGCDQILAWMREQVEAKGHDRLYVDWYGGEPMLNQAAIEHFTQGALALCAEKGMTYSAAMISNGTLWPEDAGDFVKRNRIRHLQFTLDGPQIHHDKRRRYVLKEEREQSSFDVIADTIDRLMGSTRVYLRINVDVGSAPDIMPLVDFFKERGWLDTRAHIYPYLAMIGPMTETCGFLGRNQRVKDFRDEFDQLNNAFQHAISQHIDPRGIQHLQYYPMTIKMNCAAVGSNSTVFGPDGYMYKCGLDVGQHHLAHGKVSLTVGQADRTFYQPRRAPLPVLGVKPTPHPYEAYDPFTHTRCSQCQYLPICMGGCPKTHFEKNDFYLEQQSKYWEDNFDVVVRTYYETTRTRLPAEPVAA